MTRREKSARIKAIVKSHGIAGASVSLGRGTAHHWVYITLPKSVPQAKKDSISAQLKKEGLCGHYFSDCGVNDDWTPCISWSLTNGEAF